MNEQLIGDLFAEAQRQMSGSSSREFSEKFAELIVRECADIATMNQFQWDSAGGYVLKHFGVEE